MKTLITKLLIFFAGLCLFGVALAFVPVSYFSFRNWEGMSWKTDFDGFILGKFYPNRSVVRDEDGDLGHNSGYNQVKKNVEWKVDKFGFRNDSSVSTDPRIIVVGDSNSVGSGTTQNLIFSRQLHDLTGSNVFNYSPMKIEKGFFPDIDRMWLKPKVVVYEVIERDIPTLGRVTFAGYNNSKPSLKCRAIMVLNRVLPNVLVAYDRFLKKEPINWLTGKIDSRFGKFNLPVIIGDKGFLFYKNSFINGDIDDAKLKAIGDAIQSVSDSCRKKGIKFVFVPVPNKETIYKEFLPANMLPVKNEMFLARLGQELASRKIACVDTLSVFKNAVASGQSLYFPDDTHWNSTGIALAAGLVADELRKAPQP